MTPITYIIAQAIGAAMRAAAASKLAPLVFATMVRMVPLESVVDPGENVEQRAVRWHAIADVIANAAVTPRGKEIDVLDFEQRRRAAVLLGIARHEGGPFARDVDVGPCRTASGACDGGRSVSLWQVMGFTAAQRVAFHDRAVAADEAMRRALSSESACWRNGVGRYAGYASGSCTGGLKESAEISSLIWRAMSHLEAARKRAEAEAVAKD